MTTPIQTTGSAVTGAMIAGCIVWLCQAEHWPVPPADVAGTMGALLLGGAHAIMQYVVAKRATPALPPSTT